MQPHISLLSSPAAAWRIVALLARCFCDAHILSPLAPWHLLVRVVYSMCNIGCVNGRLLAAAGASPCRSAFPEPYMQCIRIALECLCASSARFVLANAAGVAAIVMSCDVAGRIRQAAGAASRCCTRVAREGATISRSQVTTITRCVVFCARHEGAPSSAIAAQCLVAYEAKRERQLLECTHWVDEGAAARILACGSGGGAWTCAAGLEKRNKQCKVASCRAGVRKHARNHGQCSRLSTRTLHGMFDCTGASLSSPRLPPPPPPRPSPPPRQPPLPPERGLPQPSDVAQPPPGPPAQMTAALAPARARPQCT